jgi:hypothetical protein
VQDQEVQELQVQARTELETRRLGWMHDELTEFAQIERCIAVSGISGVTWESPA